MAEPTKDTLMERSGNREKPLLVIADTDASHLYYASTMLQRLDYNIYTTKTAAGVLELLDVAEPALVLTDVSLDGSADGLELLRKIKRNPRARSIPVIFLTSSRDRAIQDACTREGCAAYLQKPLDPDILYAAIQKATETSPRQYIRLSTCLNVIVGDETDPANLDAGDCVTALSEHGMYVSTQRPRPTGSLVPFTILFGGTRIPIEGSVLYSFKHGEGPLKTSGMGVKFTRIGPEEQGKIKAFIRRAIVKGLHLK